MQEFKNEGFFDEDEGEFPVLDALVEFFRNAPPDERVYVTNPARLKPAEFSCLMLQQLAQKTDKTASVNFTSPCRIGRSDGGAEMELSSFGVEGVDDMRRFGRVLEFVDAFEILALTNGSIRIILTFRKLYSPAE